MTEPATPPTYRTGKISYIEIPARDIERSADFYNRAFDWQIRKRGDGSTAFDDAVNEVSGTWVLGRPPSTEPGLSGGDIPCLGQGPDSRDTRRL
jgi:uncharacterized protein